MNNKVTCLICNELFGRITNTHLKKHCFTMSQYKTKFPDALFESKETSIERQTHKRGKKYEEIYGVNKGEELRKNRVEQAKAQFLDLSQKEIRSLKLKGRQITWKDKLTKFPERKGGFRKSALSKFGLECMRCGYKSDKEKEFIAHHNDLINICGEFEDYSDSNKKVLCRKCHAKLHMELEKTQREFVGSKFIEKGVVLILKGLKKAFGLSIKDVNFKDTPKRVARAYSEIFSGIKDTDSQVEEILSSKFPSEGYDEMVVCSGIKVYSMCPHHLLPVEYAVSLAYIPKDSVLGVSKLARLAEILAKRPVLQELLTRDIGKSLERLNPLGVAVSVSGVHFCMKMRGVRKEGSIITNYVSGAFREDQKTKEEFLTVIKMSK